jgi:hypothetical protein
MEESLIVELWDVFREYVPEKNREAVAAHYVDFLLGKDVEISILEGLMGYDPHLDLAIETVVEEEQQDDELDDDVDYYEGED